MDVRLQDGTMVTNVPDDTTQADLMERVGAHKESLAQRAITAVSAKPGEYGIPRGVTQFAASAPLPGIGAALGAAGGALAAPFTGGIVNPVTGGMAGAAAGEAGNQALGITDPSGAAIGLNALGPLLGKIPQAARAMGHGLSRILPGAGTALQERATPMAEAISKIGMPSMASKDLYEEVAKHNPYIDATPFRDQLVKAQEEVMSRIGDSPSKTSLINYIESKLNALDKSPNGTAGFKNLRATQKELNEMINAKDSGAGLGVLKQLAKGIHESFDQAAESRFAAAGVPEHIALLKQANQTFVKEKGKEELDTIIAKGVQEHEGGLRTFNDNARMNIKKALNTNEEIKGAYSKQDISQMKEALDAIGTLPGLPPKGDTLFGGIRYAGPAVAGSLLAPMVGLHPMAGVAAGMTIDLALRQIVASPLGRQTVIALAKSSGKKVAPDELMAIAAGLTGGVGGMINPAHGSLDRGIQPPGP